MKLTTLVDSLRILFRSRSKIASATSLMTSTLPSATLRLEALDLRRILRLASNSSVDILGAAGGDEVAMASATELPQAERSQWAILLMEFILTPSYTPVILEPSLLVWLSLAGADNEDDATQ